LFLSMVIGMSGAFAQNYAQIGYGTTSSPAWTGALMNTYWHDNICQIDFPACDLLAEGLLPGDTINSTGWFLMSSQGPMNGANLSVTEAGITTAVWNDGGTGWTPSFGWNDLSFSSPLVWGGGDLMVEFCFDNTTYTNSNTYQYTLTPTSTVNYAYADGQAGCSMTPLAGPESANRPNTRFGYSSGGSNSVPGCMDATAANYNMAATIDDCSCTWTCLGTYVNVNVTTVSWGAEVSWALINVVTGDTAASGGALFGQTYGNNTSYDNFVCVDSGCYVMEMYDAFGDGWNGGTFSIDDTLGTNYSSGGLLTGLFGSVNTVINGACLSGCTDPWSPSYNALAVFDDGSCLYPGCLDPSALNYCTSCNDTDNTLCIYPVCDPLDWSADFEDTTLTNWITSTGAEAYLSLSSYEPAISGTMSIEMSGNTSASWGATPLTEVAAYDPLKSSHFASAQYCLDMTSSAPTVNMTVLCAMPGFYTAPYRWIRVKVNGTVVADVGGNTAYTNGVPTAGTGAGTITSATTLTYDLSAYAGQSSVNVQFQASCKYGPAYNPLYADYVILDDINVFSVYPCTYYTTSITVDLDASCNGAADGSATVTVSSPNPTNDTYLWSDGQTTATAVGLLAGTYTCTTTDSVNGCTSTSSVTITEPPAIVLSALVIDESLPGAGDGAIDLTVSGGTPCETSDSLICGSHGSLYTGYARGYSFQAGASFTITALRASSGAGQTGTNQSVGIIDLGTTAPLYILNAPTGNVAVQEWTSCDVPAGWASIPGGFNVTAGNYYIVLGAKHAPASIGFTMQNSYGAATTMMLGGVSTSVTRAGLQGHMNDAPFSCTLSDNAWATPAGSIGRIDVQTGVLGAMSYSFAWASGDTTEDISGLSMGPQSVTVTDCNGCSETGSWFIMVNTVLGCTDPAASNYNPLANMDDGSCLYPGCIDPLAVNFDSTANISDTSCIYACTYYGLQSIQIEVSTNPWPAEVGWCLVNDATGDTVASAGYMFTGSGVGVFDVCMDYGCYTMHMFDSFGDGWNGSAFTVTDTNSTIVIGAGGLPSGSYATESFCFDACAAFALSGSVTNVSCNGGNDGSASVDSSFVASFPNATYSWTQGMAYYGSASSISNRSAGVYRVIANDGANCSDTLFLTIGEPAAMSASFVVLDAFDSTSATGSIDLTVSGGTPCILNADVACPLLGGNGQSGNAFNLINTSGAALTITGFSQGPLFPNAAGAGTLEIFTTPGSYITAPVWTSVASGPVALTAGAATGYLATPGVSIPAGGTLGVWIGLTVGTVQYTNGTGTPGVSAWGSDANLTVTEGHGGTYPTGVQFSPRNWNGTVHYGDPTANAAYTFAWSSGDSTEDISAATAGYYCVTITDCDGCVAGPFCTTVGVAYILGCMDPTFWNYNPAANVPDTCIAFAYGCTDSTANNYDPSANTNQISAIDSTSPCFYCGPGFLVVDMQIIVPAAYAAGFNHASEISWLVINIATGDTVGMNGVIAGNPYPFDGGQASAPGGQTYPGSILGVTFHELLCMPFGCYAIHMYDAWGDGWGGVEYALVDDTNAFVYSSGGLVHVGAAPYNTSFDIDTTCIDPCSQFLITGGSASDASCNGSSDGAIDITINAPNGVSFAWSNGATTEDISGLAAGSYTVVASDAYGCADSATYVVGEPASITASFVVIDESGPGNLDGSIDLTVAGGTPCTTVDTIWCAMNGSSYSTTQTRGYRFQAQSSFTISGVMCAEHAAGSIAAGAPNQSIEIVDFGTTAPAVYPGPGSPYTLLFSAIDVQYGWLSTGPISIVAGNHYAIMGSKHAAGGLVRI